MQNLRQNPTLHQTGHANDVFELLRHARVSSLRSEALGEGSQWMTTAYEFRWKPQPIALAGTALSGVLASGFLGGTTNAVNGAVSPTYFVTILGWKGIEDVWRASIAQGIFERLLFGVFFSLVFTVATGTITRVSCSFGFAFRHLLGIMGGAYICWALGGLLAMSLATLSPEFYRQAFIGVPGAFGAMLRYAWVDGSIWGAELGGLVSVVVGLVVLRANWRRQVSEVSVTPNQSFAPDRPREHGASCNAKPAWAGCGARGLLEW
jgi:hypothetical protein